MFFDFQPSLENLVFTTQISQLNIGPLDIVVTHIG